MIKDCLECKHNYFDFKKDTYNKSYNSNFCVQCRALDQAMFEQRTGGFCYLNDHCTLNIEFVKRCWYETNTKQRKQRPFKPILCLKTTHKKWIILFWMEKEKRICSWMYEVLNKHRHMTYVQFCTLMYSFVQNRYL